MDSKSIIAPIIITCVLVVLLLFHMCGVVIIINNIVLRLIVIGVYLVLIATSISVLCGRMGKIRSDEEDDLSKY